MATLVTAVRSAPAVVQVEVWPVASMAVQLNTTALPAVNTMVGVLASALLSAKVSRAERMAGLAGASPNV